MPTIHSNHSYNTCVNAFTKALHGWEFRTHGPDAIWAKQAPSGRWHGFSLSAIVYHETGGPSEGVPEYVKRKAAELNQMLAEDTHAN